MEDEFRHKNEGNKHKRKAFRVLGDQRDKLKKYDLKKKNQTCTSLWNIKTPEAQTT